MPMLTGLILLCLLGTRLGFSYPYIYLVHHAIHYFEKKKSVFVYITSDLLIVVVGFIVGGVAYLIDSIFFAIPAPGFSWRIQPIVFIYSLLIAGGTELYKFYSKRASISILSFAILMIGGCCLSVYAADEKINTSSGVFSVCCGLAFSTGILFSETILKIITFEKSMKNSMHFMVVAERRTSVLIGYMYLLLAVIQFALKV